MGIARFGEPDEIASAVAFLASPQSSYIHSAILDADCGQTRTLVSPASTTPGGMPGAPEGWGLLAVVWGL